MKLEVSKNRLCKSIQSSVPVEFIEDDTNATIRYEPPRNTKVLSSDS